MYHTTGFSKDGILALCELITGRFDVRRAKTGRRRALGLFTSVTVTLAYLRRNHVQQELGEFFDVSQSTICRTIAAFTPTLVSVLDEGVPTVEDLDPCGQLIIDGILLPCWSWSHHLELWSGKRRATGLSVQVAATLSGTLAWICDPTPGKDPGPR